ncbi:hypothetical protein D3C79_932480 [compost metagenome]
MHSPHHEHDAGREQQTGGEEVTGVGAVRHVPHQKLGQTIGDGDARQGQAQITAGESLLDQIGHRQAEVLAHQVVTGVAEEDPEKHLPTHALVEGIDLIGR